MKGDKKRAKRPSSDPIEASEPRPEDEGELAEASAGADDLRPEETAEPSSTEDANATPDDGRDDRDEDDGQPRAETEGGGEDPPGPPGKSAPRGTELSIKLSASIAIAAAIALAVVLNIVAVRHFKRWDFTKGGLFTLSDGTTQTLHGLTEPVTLIVLLSNGDPLEGSVHQLLDAYRAETGELQIQFIDPDRKPAEFIAIQQKYDLSAAKTQDGHVVAETAIVVARGEKHHFITSDDLVVVDDADDMRARPRLEQAITGGIRNVLDDVRSKVCLTTGHGEHGVEEGGDAGLTYLRERLVKNNYEVVSVFGQAATEKDPLEGCNLLILAAPTTPVPKEDVAAIKRYVENGGSALLVAGPVPSEEANDYIDLGVGDLFALAGVELQKAVVFETDPAHRFSRGYGEVFYPETSTHAITAPLEREQEKGTRAVLNVTGALKDLGNGTTPVPLLKTTDQAVGVTDFFGWARDPRVPSKTDRDLGGPFVLAVAAERAKKSASDDRGPRIVAIACPTMLFGVNWREPGLRGNAMFVESAISWLGSHRAFLDIPNRPPVTLGVRLTESSIQKIFVFTVGILPGISGAVGVYVFLLRRRRPTEKKSADKAGPKKAEPKKTRRPKA